MSSSFSVINGDREIEHDRFEGMNPTQIFGRKRLAMKTQRLCQQEIRQSLCLHKSKSIIVYSAALRLS